MYEPHLHHHSTRGVESVEDAFTFTKATAFLEFSVYFLYGFQGIFSNKEMQTEFLLPCWLT